jgi:hypothetical protein
MSRQSWRIVPTIRGLYVDPGREVYGQKWGPNDRIEGILRERAPWIFEFEKD